MNVFSQTIKNLGFRWDGHNLVFSISDMPIIYYEEILKSWEKNGWISIDAYNVEYDSILHGEVSVTFILTLEGISVIELDAL